MSDLVNPEKIEAIVGAKRHAMEHIARAVSAEQTVYIMHSQECLDSLVATTTDIRQCRFARAQDTGIDPTVWADFQDVPVRVVVSAEWGDLEPMEVVP
jgi:hypothetical protein